MPDTRIRNAPTETGQAALHLPRVDRVCRNQRPTIPFLSLLHGRLPLPAASCHEGCSAGGRADSCHTDWPLRNLVCLARSLATLSFRRGLVPQRNTGALPQIRSLEDLCREGPGREIGRASGSSLGPRSAAAGETTAATSPSPAAWASSRRSSRPAKLGGLRKVGRCPDDRGIGPFSQCGADVSTRPVVLRPYLSTSEKKTALGCGSERKLDPFRLQPFM